MHALFRALRIPVAVAAVMTAVAPVSGQALSASGTPSLVQAAQAPAAQVPAAPAGPIRRLTIDEAVALALEQNLALRVERINPLIEDQNVRLARTAWTPIFGGNLTFTDSSTPPDSFLSGAEGETTLKSERLSSNMNVQQLLPWGQDYTFTWNGSRQKTNNVFSTFNPRLGTDFDFTFNQPLLRNFGIDNARQQLIVSKRNREISDVDLRAAVVNTIRNVRTAYVGLTLARANLLVQQQSLELARQTLKDNRTRVEIGTMAPIDIVEAEAEVARNEEGVIVAEAQIRQAEDSLRAIIFDPSTPEFWNMTIDTAEDIPAPQPVAIDTNAAIQEALGKRTDLQRFRKSLEITEVNMKYYRNQVLPQVNLRVSYGADGLGGEQTVREPGFPPGDIIGTAQRGFGSALGDAFTFDYPTWSTGVIVSMPLGTSAAKANLARTQLQYDQAKLQLSSLEMQVGVQVRDAVRTLETAYKRVEATRASRQLSERRLEAEQKKFGVGMSTSFLVFQAQRDLALARTNELQAVYDYYRAQVNFEAVMETSIGGGSGVTVAGGQ